MWIVKMNIIITSSQDRNLNKLSKQFGVLVTTYNINNRQNKIKKTA